MTNRDKRKGLCVSSVVVVALLVFACGASRGESASPDSKEGPAERAGRKLDRAAGEAKEAGDEIGQKVGDVLGGVGKDVREKIGDDPKAPPPDPAPKN